MKPKFLIFISLFLLLFVVVAVVLISAKVDLMSLLKIQVNKIKNGKCAMENCHGLDLVCGSNAPEACTEEYRLGDFCRQFALCQEENNQCVLKKEEEFDLCRACVEKCEQENTNNPTDAFACENSCRNQFEAGGQITEELIVESPSFGETVNSPLSVRGRARGFWFFEASFPVKLLDANNQIIASGVAQAKSDWMTEDFVDFEVELKFEVSELTSGTLVLEKDNPSGLPENDKSVEIPIHLEPTGTMVVKVFFNNSELDPEFSCNKVFAVKRTIAKTSAPARAALEELLKGVTKEEKDDAYQTSINTRVKIQSLVIKKGTAYVDFDEQLQYQVGGSCRVGAISAQIRETLKQFSTVSNVVISINGRTEDILQP